jgi:ribonucleoside-diphosphate reductase alpha chain
MAENAGILDERLKKEISVSPSLADVSDIPQSFKDIFRTSNDIAVEWHIRIQAAFQRHTDNAVSKTINFPRNATVQDVSKAFIMAYDAGLKGLTIYRDSSKDKQVLTVGKSEQETVPSHSRERLKPRPRPSVTTGTTEKLKTGCGNLYVTVNSDNTGLCEVFCQMGRSGGCTSSQSEAISRLISLTLRSGVNLNEVVSELKGIRCPSPIWQNGRLILSCADAIATALSRYQGNDLNTLESEGIPVLTQDTDSILLTKKSGRKIDMAGVCPDCGGVLETAEGCLICRTCGFAKCG